MIFGRPYDKRILKRGYTCYFKIYVFHGNKTQDTILPIIEY